MASVILRDGREADVARLCRPDATMIDRLRRMGACEMRRQGVSVVLIARHYGVTRKTIHAWLRTTPEAARRLASGDD